MTSDVTPQGAPVAPVPEPVVGNFRDLGIEPEILEQVEKHFQVPTPIQAGVIRAGGEGRDVIGIAQTGTGKTLAFGIPMLQRLLLHGGQGLVLVPTRELALQVDEMLLRIGRPLRLKTCVVIGGLSMVPQKQALSRNPNVVIATPGRLIDHMRQGTYRPDRVRAVVLDEADRMLDIGFLPDISRILETVPDNRQTMLFSATLPAEVEGITSRFMRDPVRVQVAAPGTTAERVDQGLFIAHKEDKLGVLEEILANFDGTILVFTRTKFAAKRVTAALCRKGHAAAEIHSNRSLSQRREALEGFKKGKYRVLVATDIAARGIDVTGIGLVVNFDLPDNPHDYVHRIGRTGRAGREGKALTFATPEERAEVRQIERVIRAPLEIVEGSHHRFREEPATMRRPSLSGRRPMRRRR